MNFKGVSRDQVSFDSNGNGVGAYDITVVNMETERWEPIGSWVSNTSNVLDIPANASFLYIDLAKLRLLWGKVFNNSEQPTSFCGQECPPGHWIDSEELHQVCCYIPREDEDEHPLFSIHRNPVNQGTLNFSLPWGMEFKIEAGYGIQ